MTEGLPSTVSTDKVRLMADYLDFDGYETASDMLCALASERDALAVRVRELEAERDAITELNHAQWLALENARHLAARNRNEEWAQHLLRWCTEAGNAARILRALTTPESKP